MIIQLIGLIFENKINKKQYIITEILIIIFDK